jgi:HAD superfamily hydrolase (TIGR01509 family)
VREAATIERESQSVDAVVFDLDGVLVDSEQVWDDVRRAFVDAHGGHWRPDAQRRMMGMATREWASYLRDELHVDLPVEDIAERVVDDMAARYGQRPPVLPGAVAAVERVARRWPLGLASSSPTRLIHVVLDAMGVRDMFRTVLSTEEVGRGKPAPDVYLEVADRLRVVPDRCAAVEDSTNGLAAARAAGMRVIAVPNRAYPPDPAELERADAVIPSLGDLSEAVVDPAS